MTEREILKKLVEGKLDEAFRAAQELLDDSPKREHPAIAAYRKWCNSLDTSPIAMADSFLAGWKQALEWSSREAGGMMRSMKWFNDASWATPEHLP